MHSDRIILALGGAGLVGSQIVREIAREMEPERIVVASLYRGEVREFLHDARREFCNVDFVGAWGDVFVRDEFMEENRRRLISTRSRRDSLYQDLYGGLDDAYARSGLVQLIRRYRPNVIVDCINTATAISYQDSDSQSKRVHDLLAQLSQAVDHQDLDALAQLGREVEANVSSLIISQSLPQLIRHVQLIHRAMSEVGTRLYLKIGTTGTGGMGLNIPYTHSEDRPSFKLMSKTAVAFAHTGLMFLMARTPDGPLVKELKPAAMIGYRRVAYKAVKLRGQPQIRYQSVEQPLGSRLLLRGDENQYERVEKLHMAGVDTGENGFFARGEFETITHTDQMEFITPEEIAAQAVLEILGSNTGYDIIAGIDGSVLTPSYRAGVLRQAALEKLERIEEETGSHSVALGQLGPPQLSKLLYEAHLLKLNYGTLSAVLAATAEEIAQTLFDYLHRDDILRTTITSIGVPILTPAGDCLIRGPRLNIPESIYHEIDADPAHIDAWAAKGWVDLRPSNFRLWRDRFERMQRTKHMLHTRGTSSVTMKTYLPETIEIGAVVAWLFINEDGGYRIK